MTLGRFLRNWLPVAGACALLACGMKCKAASPTPVPTPDESRMVKLSGEVNDDSAEDFIRELQSVKGKHPVWILINSRGGHIDSGARMENAIDQAKTIHSVNCVVDGDGLSMAAGIFEECDLKLITPGSSLLFHSGSFSVSDGERFESAQLVAHTLAMFREMDARNARNLKMPLDAYISWMGAGGAWLTADSAVFKGAADAVLIGWVPKAEPKKVEVKLPWADPWH